MFFHVLIFFFFFFFFWYGSLGCCFVCLFFRFLPTLLTPPHLLLFMKLENLKDCCVFVNNQTLVHSVRVNVPSSSAPLLLEPVSPRMWSVSPCVPLPDPRCVNVWDQTLFSGCARVTLTTKKKKKKPLSSGGGRCPQSPAWSGLGLSKVRRWRSYFHGLPVFKLHCRFFFLYGGKKCFI